MIETSESPTKNIQTNIENLSKQKSNSESQKQAIQKNTSPSPIAILNSKFGILKKLGSGSSGSVYLSYLIQEQSNLSSFYAIKIITKGKTNFINPLEVEFLEKFQNKNILKVFEHGIGKLQLPNGNSQQVYYIVMEYINHGSLHSQINNNQGFNEDLARLIFSQLLDGLESIHNSDIVHRDIKLENIMISGNDYTLKLVDFGFATKKSYGLLDTFLGTPAYAAPELHLKQKYFGEFEDIYSLGITLFILVTGSLPFMLPLPNDSLYKYIYMGDYDSFWKKRNVNVSQGFKELFNNLVAFNPEQRPSISEIRQSQWMKEINYRLKEELKNEFIRREKENIDIELKIQERKRNMMKNRIKVNNYINNKYNDANINSNIKEKNVDDILAKIEEKKKIEFANDIKKHLFPIEINNNINTQNEVKNVYIELNQNSITQEKGNVISKDIDNLTGFIYINYNIKKITLLTNLLRAFFKNEGYAMTNRDLKNLKMELSNGEVDVLLSFDKMYKVMKINYTIINGNKQDFINFKKIVKKINIKDDK